MNLEAWPILQILSCMVTSSGSTYYLNNFSPFESVLETRIEIMNEYTSLILLYSMLGFTDLLSDPEDRSNVGNIYLAVTLLNLVLHITVLIIMGLKGHSLRTKKNCRKYESMFCCRRRGPNNKAIHPMTESRKEKQKKEEKKENLPLYHEAIKHPQTEETS